MKFIGQKFILGCGLLIVAFFALIFFSPASALAADNSIIDYYNLNNYSLNSGKNNGNTGGGYCSDRWGTGTTSDNGDTALRDLFDQCGPITFNFASSTNNAISFSTGGGFSSCWFTKESDWGVMYHRSAVDIGNGAGFGNNEFTVNGPSGSNGFSFTTGSADMSTIANGAWHQICFVVDPIKTEIYFDAAKVFTGVHNNVPNDFTFTSAIFSPAYSYAKFGFIDNLISINRPITAGEIETIYNAGSNYDNLTLGSQPTNDYILAYPATPNYDKIGNDFNIPYVLNVCEYQQANPSSTLRVYLESGNTNLGSQTLSGCSGRKTFSATNSATEGSFQDAVLEVWDITKDKSVAMSSQFWEVIYTQVANLEMKTVKFEPLSGLVYVDGVCNQYGGGINQMRIVGQADNATSTLPVYPDPLGASRGGLVSCNGNDTFTAIYDANGLTGSHYIAIDDTFFGTEWANIQVNFDATSTASWENDKFLIQDDTTETAKKLACTDDEWASENIITKTKCRVGQAIYTGVFAIRDKAKEYGNGLVYTFKNTFPFNFSVFVKTTWEKSETAELPANLQFLNFSDSNGDIKLDTKIGNSTSSIPIFGKSIFQNDESKDTYENIRNISTWLFRGMVLVYTLMIGIKIYHELNGSKHNDD